MKKQAKQFTSLLCVLVLCLTLLPVSALASGLEEPGTPAPTPTASMSPESSAEPSPEPTPEESTEPEPVESAEPTPIPTETPAPENETELFADDSAVYVSANGAVDGDGTREKPYATLAAAVASVQENGTATIYVMSDLTLTNSLRYWEGKNITITSDPESLPEGETAFTIFRAATGFIPVQDDARGGYNPAMIEVGNGANLTLTNIILDDGGYAAYTDDPHAGTTTGTPYFVQVDASRSGNPEGEPQPGSTEIKGKEVSNHKIVQDAIIASYDSNSTITLGEGAVLQNFGGMSAVRVSGATLIMEDGSKITDTTVNDRIRGGTGSNGPAGAVWVQSGTLIMEEGSEICDVLGRAIYADGIGSDVIVDGTISNIKADAHMWQDSNGVAVYLRNCATATFEEHCDIFGETTGGSCAVYAIGNNAEQKSIIRMNYGAKIHDLNTKAIQLYQFSDATLNGEIYKISGTQAVHMNISDSLEDAAMSCTIGENGYLHDNTVNYGTIYAQGNGSVLHIYGRINNNHSTQAASALNLSNNWGGQTAYIYEGAQICNNTATRTNTEANGAIYIGKGHLFMEGGTISDNVSITLESVSKSIVGTAICVGDPSGTFTMTGGTISGNATNGIGSGVVSAGGTVMLRGGTINGNIMQAEIDENYTIIENTGIANDVTVGSNGSANLDKYLCTSENLQLSEQSIHMQKYDFYIERTDGVKLGNAAAVCETAAENAIETKYENQYMEVKGSFWYQSGDICSLNLRELNYDPTKPLFVGIVETDKAGTPSGQITIQAVGVENGQISLPLRANENGYAVVFVQETEDSGIITVTPASLTAYMGGEEGYEGVVGDGTVTTAGSSSFPHPLFLIQAPQGVEIGNLDFQNGNNHWKAVVVNPGTTGNTYYRFEKTGSTTTDVRVQYDNGTGPVMEDYFEPELVGDVYKNYIVSIYGGENGTDGVIAGVDEKPYQILTGEGVLTVRAVEEDQATAVKPVQDSPTTAAEGSAVAVVPDGTEYTLNDTGVVLPSGHSVSLLFDEIITSDGIDRMTPLQEKADEFLKSEDENRRYEIKYLDLVDANNGNAWVKSSKGVDIYWGYPEGTDSSTQFTLLHFPGLHRDGAQSGFDVDDIDAVTPESVPITNTGYGIMFHVEEGGFSPFALVWSEAQEPSPEPTPDPEPSDPGSSSGGSTSVRRYDIDASAGRGGDISPDGRVRVRRGENQTFRITPDEGYEIYDVIVDGESVGAVGRYTFENVREDHTISVTFRLIQEEVDTGVSRWLNTEDHIAYLQGYPGGLFGPDDNMTRAEAAQMFYNLLLEQDVASTVSFTDVAPDAWYADAVNALASLGMVEGVGGGLFAPERTITRAEFTVIAMRFAYLPDGGENPFSDVAEDDWFYDQVVGAVQYGWITGYPDGTFGSEDTITRAEVTAIVNRMLNRQADENYVDSHAAELIQFTDLSPAYWAYYDIMEAANGHTYEKSGGAEVWTGIR